MGQGEMSKMPGLPLDASFFEFKAWWQFFFVAIVVLLKDKKCSCSLQRVTGSTFDFLIQ